MTIIRFKSSGEDITMCENDMLLMNDMMSMDAAVDGSRIWFTDGETGDLFSFDLYQNNLVFYGNYDELKFCARKVFIQGRTLFFVAQSGLRIVEVEIDDKRVFVKTEHKIVAEDFRVKNAFLYINSIVIIPYSTKNPICFFDCSSKKMTYTTLRFSSEENDEEYSFVDLHEGVLYCSFYKRTGIFQFDFHEKLFTKIDLLGNRMIDGLCVENNSIWFKSGVNLYKYEINGGLSQYCNIVTRTEGSRTDGFRRIIVCGGKVLLLPCTTSDILIFDSNNQTIFQIDLINEFKRKKKHENTTYSIGVNVLDNTVYLLPWSGEVIVQINIYDNTLVAKEIMLKDVNCYKYVRKKYFSDIVTESEEIGIDLFLRCCLYI